MKTYELGIVYRVQADDPSHAIEQFLDIVIHPDRQGTEVDTDVESAINLFTETEGEE